MPSSDRTAEAVRQAWVQLQASWEQTRSTWRDGVAERFEREYLDEWHEALPPAIQALEALEAQLDRAEASAQTI